jgi:hypothetical protein
MVSLPFSKGDVCGADRGILMGVLTIDVNVLCVKPITISQPGVQLSSGKRALGRGNCAVWGQSHQVPSLSPVGSSLLGREPTVESIACFRDRVIRFHLRLCRGVSILLETPS